MLLFVTVFPPVCRVAALYDVARAINKLDTVCVRKAHLFSEFEHGMSVCKKFKDGCVFDCRVWLPRWLSIALPLN